MSCSYSPDKDNSVQVSFQSGYASTRKLSLSLMSQFLKLKCKSKYLAEYLCLIWVWWHFKYIVKLYLKRPQCR